MKYSLILLIQCLFISAAAQTGTIRVKKSNNCDFELKADTSLLNKSYKISSVSMSGISHEAGVDFLLNANYILCNTIFISKEQFEIDLKEYCNTKKYKLESIQVTKSQQQSICEIDILFNFIKK